MGPKTNIYFSYKEQQTIIFKMEKNVQGLTKLKHSLYTHGITNSRKETM
jgi:hypothetical protein